MCAVLEGPAPQGDDLEGHAAAVRELAGALKDSAWRTSAAGVSEGGAGVSVLGARSGHSCQAPACQPPRRLGNLLLPGH